MNKKAFVITKPVTKLKQRAVQMASGQQHNKAYPYILTQKI